jgi:hypothetical protein
VNDLPLALRAGVDGIGIVQLPEAWISPLVAEGRLIQLLEDWSPRWTDFSLFYPSRRHVPIKLRTLVDFLRRGSKHLAETDRHQGHRSAIKLRTIPGGKHLGATSKSPASVLSECDIASAV